MTEDEEEHLRHLRRKAQGDADCFTPEEGRIIRMRAEGASFREIGEEFDCTGSNIQRIYTRIQRKKKRAHELAELMVEADLKAKRNKDLRIAYAEPPNIADMIKLLLPHVNEIKELTK